jgi:hypothetical protein
MSKGKKIALGVIGALVVLCGLFMAFVSWANSDAGQATFKEVETKNAIEAATVAVQNTQGAQATSNAAGTATAEMQSVGARIQNAQLVFDESFDEGSAFIAANIGGKRIYFRDGIPEISAGIDVWKSGKVVKDFVAEVDCATSGAGTFCGIAYGVNQDFYYASYIQAGEHCGFDDRTSSFSNSRSWPCSYPSSPTTPGINRVRLERFGKNMRFYVNGGLMDERVLDNTESQTGDVGLYLGQFDMGDAGALDYVKVDSFKIWEMP